MKYTVVWRAKAFDQLADVWLRAAERDKVTSAIHRIEQQLSRSPLDSGESREGNERVVFDPPLVVKFEVVADDRKVRILLVHDTTRKRK
jgi:hypothetical protein